MRDNDPRQTEGWGLGMPCAWWSEPCNPHSASRRGLFPCSHSLLLASGLVCSKAIFFIPPPISNPVLSVFAEKQTAHFSVGTSCQLISESGLLAGQGLRKKGELSSSHTNALVDGTDYSQGGEGRGEMGEAQGLLPCVPRLLSQHADPDEDTRPILWAGGIP